MELWQYPEELNKLTPHQHRLMFNRLERDGKLDDEFVRMVFGIKRQKNRYQMLKEQNKKEVKA